MATDVRLSQHGTEVLFNTVQDPDVRLSQEGVEVLFNTVQDPDVRLSQLGTEVLFAIPQDPDVRLSQLGVEVLLNATGFNTTRLSQLGVEVLVNTSSTGGDVRLSQAGIEILHQLVPSGDVRVTQSVIETAAQTDGSLAVTEAAVEYGTFTETELRVTQNPVEYGTTTTGNFRVTQCIIEVVRQTASIPPPILSIDKSHTGSFYRGQQGATFNVVVTNVGPTQTNGTFINVEDTLPTGLTLVSMAGTGWTCVGNICQRSDILASGDSFDPITVTVDVDQNAPKTMVNLVDVTGGGSVPASDTDTVGVADLLAGPLWKLYKFTVKTRREETS